MILPRFLLKRAERALNALLQRDPATPARLQPLIGRSLALSFSDPVGHLTLTANAAGLALDTATPVNTADAHVTLSPAAIGALIGGASFETLLLEGRLRTEGELSLLSEFRTLLTRLDPHLETALAALLGALPAHALVTALKRHSSHHRAALSSLWVSGRDYATEEGRWLVGERQLHVTRDLLDDLTQQLERCERRVAHLEYSTAGAPLAFALNQTLDKKEPLA